MPALILTTAIGLFAFLTSFIGEGTAYTWIVSISGLCGFIAWVGIAVSHYRFRRAFIAQGRDLSELPYKAWLFPVGPILAFILCVIIIVVKTTRFHRRYNRLVWRIRCVHWIANLLRSVLRLQIHQEN